MSSQSSVSRHYFQFLFSRFESFWFEERGIYQIEDKMWRNFDNEELRLFSAAKIGDHLSFMKLDQGA